MPPRARLVVSKKPSVSNLTGIIQRLPLKDHSMRLVWIIFHLGSATRISAAQTGSSDFSITLERAPCFGTCSSYKVTIYGDGSVLYEGRDYVAVKGVKRAVISRSTVQSLEKELRTNDFLHWQEEKKTCVDFPEVHIVANLH